MKRIFLFGLLAIGQLVASAKVLIKGKILEKETGAPLSAASIVIGGRSAVSNESGAFELRLKELRGQLIEVSHLDHRQVRDSLSKFLEGSNGMGKELIIYLERKNLFLQPVEVLATRSGTNAPLTKYNLSKKDIENPISGRIFLPVESNSRYCSQFGCRKWNRIYWLAHSRSRS
jgi:hypothetical protein